MVDVASHKVENAEKALIKVIVIGDVTFDHDPKTWTVHDQKQMLMNDENVMYQILSCERKLDYYPFSCLFEGN